MKTTNYNDSLYTPILPGIEQYEMFGERTYITIGNHTGRDLHIKISGDVHTGEWGPKQVNNNESPEVKSRKIDFGNKATYNFFIWKNNNGEIGTEIGSFDHQVRYNAAGNRDHIEFTIINIDGKTYLQVWSVRYAIKLALILLMGQ